MRVVLVLFVVCLGTAGALAQSRSFRGACGNDVKALCGSIQPGGGRIKECLKEHRAELSDACKAAIVARLKKG